MKPTFAIVGWLMFAGGSFADDGQHTGVGGNPAIPPPHPSSIGTLPPLQPQMLIIPGLLLLEPEDLLANAQKEGAASPSEGSPEEKSGDGQASTQ